MAKQIVLVVEEVGGVFKDMSNSMGELVVGTVDGVVVGVVIDSVEVT